RVLRPSGAGLGGAHTRHLLSPPCGSAAQDGRPVLVARTQLLTTRTGSPSDCRRPGSRRIAGFAPLALLTLAVLAAIPGTPLAAPLLATAFLSFDTGVGPSSVAIG